MHHTGQPRSRRTALAAIGAGLLTAALLPVAANASHGDVSLPGSSFEIDTNANLVVDHDPPSTDWAGVDENRQADQPSGTGDDSFGQGSKEDTEVPSVVSGSIPPNKSDLLTFGTYLETGDSGRFLHMFWHRVQEPSGTTNMDFEFNQSEVISSNGVTPVRTRGDLLIQYDLAQGGTNPLLFLSRWNTEAADGPCEASNSYPCWGARQDLSAVGDATGSINTTAIAAADSDGLGDVSARTFGEASVDFDALIGSDTCVSFGSAYLKSRSSDSFTAALKDFIAPAPTDIKNCGSVIIHKVTDPDPDPENATFSYTTTGGLTPSTFDLKNGETRDYGDQILAGSYSVTETDPGPDYVLTDIDCSASTTANGSSVTEDEANHTVSFDLAALDTVECTFYNELQQGALRILKQSTKDGNPLVLNDGAVFSYSDGTTTASVTDNGTGDEDSDVGEICVSGLLPGSYTVNETGAPDGYGGATESDVPFTVVVGTDCGTNAPSDAVSATFTNAPLADIQVSYRDGGSGETSLTSIDCAALGDEPDALDATPATGWDDTVTHEDIAIDPSPQTVVCTIVIDP